MKKNISHAHSGGRRVNPGPMQAEMRTGRPANIVDKTKFKTGGISGEQRTDPTHRAKVVRGKQGGSE